jgi:hypothetical protein
MSYNQADHLIIADEWQYDEPLVTQSSYSVVRSGPNMTSAARAALQPRRIHAKFID